MGLQQGIAMNYFRTAMLLAGLTALFMGVGYLIGGATGAMIALVIAAATNLFSYWNSDKVVLRMYGAHEVDENSAPELCGVVRELAPCRPADAARVRHGEATSRTPLRRGAIPQHAAVRVRPACSRC